MATEPAVVTRKKRPITHREYAIIRTALEHFNAQLRNGGWISLPRAHLDLINRLVRERVNGVTAHEVADLLRRYEAMERDFTEV